MSDIVVAASGMTAAEMLLRRVMLRSRLAWQQSIRRLATILGTGVAAVVLMNVPNEALAAASSGFYGASSFVSTSSNYKRYDLGFAAAFKKPLYRKSYFPWIVLATTIVVAGVVTYATAGAGAPAAATGVGGAASTIGGGGAGSYMAGLSMVGGWVGGNAMVGSAILNGISLGIGGGGVAWASLSVLGKVGVMASLSAVALDGILYFMPEGGDQLTYQVRLAVPQGFGPPDARDLAEQFSAAQTKIIKAQSSRNQPGLNSAIKLWDAALEQLPPLVKKAKTNPRRIDRMVVAGVIAKNTGDRETFEYLLRMLPTQLASNASYLDYLKAVSHIEIGELGAAMEYLNRSWSAAPYAIEPPLLLISLLGHQDFLVNERQILNITSHAAEEFNPDRYNTDYGLLALYYRVATFYFTHEKYDRAEEFYELARQEVSWAHYYFGEKAVRKITELGVINSLYGQGKVREADERFEKLLGLASNYAERHKLRSQYARFGSKD